MFPDIVSDLVGGDGILRLWRLRQNGLGVPVLRIGLLAGIVQDGALDFPAFRDKGFDIFFGVRTRLDL